MSADGEWVSFASLGEVAVANLRDQNVLQIWAYRSLIANADGIVAFSPTADVLISQYKLEDFAPRLAFYGPPAENSGGTAWRSAEFKPPVDVYDDVQWSADGSKVLVIGWHEAALISVADRSVIRKIEDDPLTSVIVDKGLRFAAGLHKSGRVRAFRLEVGDTVEVKPLKTLEISEATCIGVGSVAGEFFVRTRGGAFRLALPSGTVAPVADFGACKPLEQPRFRFTDRGLVDAAFGWLVEDVTATTAGPVIEAPAQGAFWQPYYTVVYLSDPGIGILRIRGNGSKKSLGYELTLAALSLALLLEVALYIWRRHTSPF